MLGMDYSGFVGQYHMPVDALASDVARASGDMVLAA